MPTGRAYALALGVALAASATSLANGFVYDDLWVIRDNPHVHSLSHPVALLTTPLWPATYRTNAYRPATTVAFALDWSLGGGRPAAFHATNVALHLLVVALVLALASRVMANGGAAPGRDRADGAKDAEVGRAASSGAVAAAPGRDRADGAKDAEVGRAASSGALVAALWFAVHPVHVEAVANGVGVSELLAAAGYLGALLAYVADGDAADAGSRGGVRRGLLSLGALTAAAVAYGAKESAITLPAVLLLADGWLSHRAGRGLAARFRRHWLLWLGVVVLAIGYLAARANVLGAGFSGGMVALGLEGRGAVARALVMAPALLVWLRWLIWPVHLSVDYLPDAFIPSARLGLPQLAGFAALLLLAWAAWASRRRFPGVAAGIVFAAVTASVAANVVVPTGVLLAERLAYLPSVGAALVVGALWGELAPSRYLWPATALVLALLAARTLLRIPVWHDETRFGRALIADAPESCRTHWALGDAAFTRGARGTGEAEMQRAVAICPDDAELIQELGQRYLDAGLFAPADRYLTAAARLDTLRSGAVVLAVLARVRGGHTDSAAALGTEAVRRFPDSPEVLGSAEQAYLAAGRPREALALARRLVYLRPGSWLFEQVAAYAAAVNGRCDEARMRLRQAVTLAPAERRLQDQLRQWRDAPGCGIAAPDPTRRAAP
jgi:Flp pilus assembly protein TadD